MKKQKFRRLVIWSKAMDFIESIYKETDLLPKDETYGLKSQIRRAAISIALNIAEGSGSNSDNEFNRFLTMALRSSYEVMSGIEIARRLQYFTELKAEKSLAECDELSAMISGLQRKLTAES